jgi:maleylpyruvate isomerase
VTVDPLVLGAEVDRATGRLLKTAEALDEAAVAAPSRLPGWSRGHVLTHLARNADSYVNLLTWAGTGRETPQYPSWEARESDIEAGAGRPAGEHVADLRAAAERFAAAVDAMTPDAWSAHVRYVSGDEVVAAHVMWARLREVEVHHVDLGWEYRPADWSDAFTLRLLHEIAGNFAEKGPSLRARADDLDFVAALGGSGGSAGAPVVSGPGRDLAGWLCGRSDGSGLAVRPEGPLPPVPTWK